MIFYKSVQLTGYTDNINIIGRTKRAISEVYKELIEITSSTAQHQCQKNKGNGRRRNRRRRGRGRSEILAINDHDTELVCSFKYLGNVNNYTIDEPEEIHARVLAANKGYYSANYIWI
jgi:hypothetical protein